MAKDVVKLAFILAIVSSVLSPSIDVIKAEIEEKRDLEPLLKGETGLATNEDKQALSRRYGPFMALSRRYGPFIQQLVFSSRDAPVTGSKECNGAGCNMMCTFLGFAYGQCDEDEDVCYCYDHTSSE